MSCGGVSQHQVVCLDVIRADGVDHNSTSQYIVVRYSTSSVEWGFDDPQTMSSYGTGGGLSWNFRMSTGYGTSTNIVVADVGMNLPIGFGGGSYYEFGASISGQYLGGTPSHVIGYTAPARPPTTPTEPGIGVSQVTQNSAYITVTPPASNGGAGITSYETEVWVNGGSRILLWGGGSGTATGLIPGTDYVARARAGNAAGWGPFTGWAPFTTIAGGRVKAGPTWVSAGAYIKAGPTWVRAQGVWKKAGPTWVK